MRVRTRLIAVAVASAVFTSACAGEPADEPGADAVAAPPTAEAADDELVAVIHRSETCGCCGAYEEFLEERGFTVMQEMHESVEQTKDELGVPLSERSCHTAEIGGYVVEGHVPLLAIRKLLAEQPDIDGIALAGMPAGSPGMPGAKLEPFVVTSIVDGEVTGEFGVY
jgi:hypothetical protein